MNDEDYCHRIRWALIKARDCLQEAVEEAEKLENPKRHPIVSDAKIIGYYTLEDEISDALHDLESVIDSAERELLGR